MPISPINPFLVDPTALNFLVISFISFSTMEFLCAIKILLVYRQNKNFVSILLLIWFILGIFVGISSIFYVYEPEIYAYYFWGTLIIYIAFMTTIFFYILDIRELYLVPIVVAIVIVLQGFISFESFDINQSLFVQTVGIIPLIGYFYLGHKNKDGKSFGMGFHWVCLFLGGLFIGANLLMIAGIIQFLALTSLGLGIFGIFDRLLLHERKKKTWIEEQIK